MTRTNLSHQKKWDVTLTELLWMPGLSLWQLLIPINKMSPLKMPLWIKMLLLIMILPVKNEFKQWLSNMMKWSFLPIDADNNTVTHTHMSFKFNTPVIVDIMEKRCTIGQYLFQWLSSLECVRSHWWREWILSFCSTKVGGWSQCKEWEQPGYVWNQEKLSLFGAIGDAICHCSLFKIEVCSSFSECSVLDKHCTYTDDYKNSISNSGFVESIQKMPWVAIVEPYSELRSIQKIVLDEQCRLPRQVNCGLYLHVPLEDHLSICGDHDITIIGLQWNVTRICTVSHSTRQQDTLFTNILLFWHSLPEEISTRRD